jgi:cell division transport system ATP-binding protein
MAAAKRIEFKNAQIFQGSNLILRNVDFNIEDGEFVYMIGKTGSGKSSLLKTLYAEIPLKEGEATVVEYDLKKLKKKDIPYLRRKIGIVFQDFQLLSDRSVYKNLEFVLRATGTSEKPKIDVRIEEEMDMVGLKNKGHKMPHELSGGEQQRVVIARALLNHPELILADEPTGNLDPETSAEIIRLLINLSKTGTAVLVATHDHSLFKQFPARTLRCENEQVIDSQISGNLSF